MTDLDKVKRAAKAVWDESQRAKHPRVFGTPYSSDEVLLASTQMPDEYFAQLLQWAYQEIIELRKVAHHND